VRGTCTAVDRSKTIPLRLKPEAFQSLLCGTGEELAERVDFGGAEAKQGLKPKLF
jgi:hypothetical protein